MEGLHQYTWEEVYTRLISWAMKDLGMQHILLIRGDNVRVAVLHPKATTDEDLKVRMLQVKESVGERLSQWGH